MEGGFRRLRPHFLEDDTLAVRRAAKGVALELSAQVSLLIALLRPPLLATHGPQLARRVDSARLTCRQVEGQGAQPRLGAEVLPSLVTTTGLMLAASGHTHKLAGAISVPPESAKGWRGAGCWLTAPHVAARLSGRPPSKTSRLSYSSTWKGGQAATQNLEGRRMS